MAKLKAGSNSHEGTESANNPGLVKKKAVARDNEVSERTIDNWIRDKRIPFVRVSPRLIRFNLARVRAALRRFEVKEVTR